MTTKKQLMSWDGSRNVFLWIIKTATGNKRTWKATEAEARAAAEARGLIVKSMRAGIDADSLVNKKIELKHEPSNEAKKYE